MLLKTKDGHLDYHVVVDFPLMKFGQKYSDNTEILDLISNFNLPLSLFKITEIAGHYWIPCKDDILTFTKSLLLLASLKEKQHYYVKDKIKKEIKAQETLLESKKKSKVTPSPGPKFKTDPLKNAIQSQHNQSYSPLPDKELEDLISKMVGETPKIKFKTQDQIYAEVKEDFKSLVALAEWLEPKSLCEVITWLDVLHDILDQAMDADEITDSDQYIFTVEIANNGKQNMNYIALKMKGQLNVLPKWLQKSGFKMGALK